MDNANAASAVSPTPKSSSLRVRVVSALVLLPFIIGIVWASYWLSAAVIAVVVILSLRELYRSYAHGGFQPLLGIGYASALAVLASVAVQPLLPPDLPIAPLAVALTITVVGSLLSGLGRAEDHQALVNWALTLAGALYVGYLFSFILSLRALDTPLRPGVLSSLGLNSGAAWVFTMMMITWLQDTFAYFVGKRWGRTQLAPRLSPKKTREGAVGGMIGAVFGALASILIFCIPLSIFQAALLGLAGGIMGPLGDLSESLMKRQVGVKDAGSIIPGHGGILDRADSLLFTAPVLYYLIVLLVG